MARSGKKTISIEAPLMVTSDKVAVWMDEGEWAKDFFSWCEEEKFRITGFSHAQGNKIVVFKCKRMYNVWIEVCQQEIKENFSN